MDRDVDTSPIAPALAAFFDDVLDQSVSQLNFKAIVDGLGDVLFRFPFHVPAYYALILRSLTVLEGLALQADPNYRLIAKCYPYMANRLLTDPAPELRASFEELIIKDGTFRWNRLENLVNEGSKSQFFDPSSLWLLADWLLSPNAQGVRSMVVVEAARMVDAVAAQDARDNIKSRLPSLPSFLDSAAGKTYSQLAELLIPKQPNEDEAFERARLLINVVTSKLPSSPISSSATGTQGSSSLVALEGSGPLGLPTPWDVEKVISQLRERALGVWPRLEGLMSQRAASELVQTLASQLSQRFAARAIKFAFGGGQVLGLVERAK